MEYVVVHTRRKEVRWQGFEVNPSLADLIEAARKEFPATPFEQLVITSSGLDGEIVQMYEKP